MARHQRIALSLPIPGNAHASLDRALWAERHGFQDVWIADSGDLDALTLAAAVALKTEKVRIGTAVVPVYPRTPAIFASTAATIASLAPGRFILGLGSSSQTMMEGWHGVEFSKPLTRVKETATLVRSMLAGQKSDFDGETIRSHGFRANPLPKPPVPIYLAGLLPKMLEMAGEVGDGVILNLFPLSALPKMIEHIEIGAKRAGKTLADVDIVCRHQVCVTDDLPAARDFIRKRFAPYFATPVYNNFLRWFGFPEVADQIERGWKEKNRAMTEGALSDSLVEQIAVMGPADKCREEVRAFIKGGITTPMIAAFAVDPNQYEATQEAFLPERFL